MATGEFLRMLGEADAYAAESYPPRVAATMLSIIQVQRTQFLNPVITGLANGVEYKKVGDLVHLTFKSIYDGRATYEVDQSGRLVKTHVTCTKD